MFVAEKLSLPRLPGDPFGNEFLSGGFGGHQLMANDFEGADQSLGA